MVELVVAVAAVACALFAILSNRLLASAVWLAGTSAMVALMLYLLGAPQVGAIELSVGAGLVTVLFVFAIGIAGDEPLQGRSLVPRPLAAILVLVALGLLAYLYLPVLGIRFVSPFSVPANVSFGSVLWQQRGLDVLVQVVLIFCGALGALGLLGETPQSEPAKRGRAEVEP